MRGRLREVPDPPLVLVSIDVETPLAFTLAREGWRPIEALSEPKQSVEFSFAGRTIYWREHGDAALVNITVQAPDASLKQAKQDGDFLLRFVSALAYWYGVPLRVVNPPSATMRYHQHDPAQVVGWSYRRPAVHPVPGPPAEIPDHPHAQLTLALNRTANNVYRADPFAGFLAYWNVVELAADAENVEAWIDENAAGADVDAELAASLSRYRHHALNRTVPDQSIEMTANPDRVEDLERMQEVALAVSRLALRAIETRWPITGYYANPTD